MCSPHRYRFCHSASDQIGSWDARRGSGCIHRSHRVETVREGIEILHTAGAYHFPYWTLDSHSQSVCKGDRVYREAGKAVECHEVDASVSSGIYRLAATQEREHEHGFGGRGCVCGGGRSHRCHAGLKHFVIDWTEDGRGERRPTLDGAQRVEELEREVGEREGKKVLVPGAGLVRYFAARFVPHHTSTPRFCAADCPLGFDTTTSERSHSVNLAFKPLPSLQTTREVGDHRHPFVHWWSHQRSTSSTSRQVPFPDAAPRLSDTFHLEVRDFFDALPRRPHVVILSFIDTSQRDQDRPAHLLRLLNPGGI